MHHHKPNQKSIRRKHINVLGVNFLIGYFLMSIHSVVSPSIISNIERNETKAKLIFYINFDCVLLEIASFMYQSTPHNVDDGWSDSWRLDFIYIMSWEQKLLIMCLQQTEFSYLVIFSMQCCSLWFCLQENYLWFVKFLWSWIIVCYWMEWNIHSGRKIFNKR